MLNSWGLCFSYCFCAFHAASITLQTQSVHSHTRGTWTAVSQFRSFGSAQVPLKCNTSLQTTQHTVKCTYTHYKCVAPDGKNSLKNKKPSWKYNINKPCPIWDIFSQINVSFPTMSLCVSPQFLHVVSQFLCVIW